MLAIEHVTTVFNEGTINEKVALNDVSLQISDGEFAMIIGTNGSGKSTLLNSIAGTVMVDAGKIMIDDEDITELAEYKRASLIGRVFQDPLMGTAPTMQVIENLALAKRRGERRGLNWEITRKEKNEFREALSVLGLGLEDRLTAKVGTLSGGQRQALTLLMATIKKPKLLLLDEPTAALDPKTSEVVMNLTQKIVKENNLTTLMITHNMEDANSFGSRIIKMKDGKIV